MKSVEERRSCSLSKWFISPENEYKYSRMEYLVRKKGGERRGKKKITRFCVLRGASLATHTDGEICHSYVVDMETASQNRNTSENIARVSVRVCISR